MESKVYDEDDGDHGDDDSFKRVDDNDEANDADGPINEGDLLLPG